MKGMARSFVYWPGIDGDIEKMAKSCNACAIHANKPAKFGDHHWEFPSAPWERIHIDYAGPSLGVMLLIVIDAFSKWIEVKITSSTTSGATIQILDEMFSTYGVPKTVVSDNGTNFSSTEFRKFLKVSGVMYHKQTAPYHLATNEQAERSVQTIKNALKTMGSTRAAIQGDLNQFLQQYRNAPHSTTGQLPSVLFLGRRLRSRLDLVRPENISHKIKEKQYVDFNPNFRTFELNENVYFLSGNPRMDKWLMGTIKNRLGDLHYEIEFRGKLFKRHVDQIRSAADNIRRSSHDWSSQHKTTTRTSCNVTSPPDYPLINNDIVREEVTTSTPNIVKPSTYTQNIHPSQTETEHEEQSTSEIRTPTGNETGSATSEPIAAPRRIY